MAIASQSETRDVNRFLQYTRDAFLPGIYDNAYNHDPASAIFFGKLTSTIFKERPMNSSGRMTQSGGESIVQRVRLGQNDTRQDLAGPFDTITTTPQSNVRFARYNWKWGSAAITLSEHDLNVNVGEEALSSVVSGETEDAISSLVDQKTEQLYQNNAVATAINDLDTLISANDTVGGLSGATFSEWNSRGISARGTAAGSISFASGSFAAQGLADMRTSYNNCCEGMMKPHVGLTTWDIYGFFVGSIQPQQQFNNPAVADVGFQNMLFQGTPVMGGAKCESGRFYWVNLDTTMFVFLSGSEFSAGPFEEAESQAARVSKVLVTGNLVTKGRKFSNKLTGVTA